MSDGSKVFFHVKYGTTFLALDHFMNLSLNIVENQPSEYCVHSPLKCRVPDIFKFFAKKWKLCFLISGLAWFCMEYRQMLDRTFLCSIQRKLSLTSFGIEGGVEYRLMVRLVLEAVFCSCTY